VKERERSPSTSCEVSFGRETLTATAPTQTRRIFEKKRAQKLNSFEKKKMTIIVKKFEAII
jgi:hypothetical protein